MQVFKKSLAALTALTLSAAILLSGCGGSSSSADPSSSTAETTVEATVETTVQSTTESKPGNTADIDPLLWKVEGKNGNTMYLFGTIHVGDERNKQVLDMLKDEISASDAVAAEFDTVAYKEDTNQQLSTVMSMLLNDGTTIKDHMRADLYEKSVKYLTDAGLYMTAYDMYNMGFWNNMLSSTAVRLSSYSTDYGMEDLVLNEAKSGNKEILELESAQSQTDLISGFSDELQNLLIEAFLDTADTYSDEIKKLHDAWIAGDEDKLSDEMEGETEDDDEELTPEQQKLLDDYRKKMYDDRNDGMAKKAVEYLESGKNVFFTAGTAHFLGDKGIVKQLTDKGYKVERIHIS